MLASQAQIFSFLPERHAEPLSVRDSKIHNCITKENGFVHTKENESNRWNGLQSMLSCKRFSSKKSLETQIFISWRLFPPSSYTFLLLSLKFFTLPMGLKESPSQKSVKPRVTFSCFKASFLWLSRILWQWMNFCRDKLSYHNTLFQIFKNVQKV